MILKKYFYTRIILRHRDHSFGTKFINLMLWCNDIGKVPHSHQRIIFVNWKWWPVDLTWKPWILKNKACKTSWDWAYLVTWAKLTPQDKSLIQKKLKYNLKNIKNIFTWFLFWLVNFCFDWLQWLVVIHDNHFHLIYICN